MPGAVSEASNYIWITSMKSGQNLHIDQQIGQRLTQQQLRFVKLLELNAPEIEQAVERELEENPALEVKDQTAGGEELLTDDGGGFNESSEEMQKADFQHPDDIPFQRYDNTRQSSSKDYPYTPPDDSESIYDNLDSQLAVKNLSPDERELAEYIIGNLDSNGYLTRTPAQMESDIIVNLGTDVDPALFRRALEAVRSLDPAGIGAENLRDCLLLQLSRRPADTARDDAIVIIDRYFDEFTKKHTHRLVSQMKVGEPRIRAAIDLIRSLNPKPGALLGSGPGQNAQTIIPDFVITVDDGEISVQLNSTVPELQIDESFSQAVARMERNARRRARKGSEYITSRFNEAHDFISLMKQRNETLFAVMTAIVKMQREYFLTEDVSKLRPMGIKDVAAMTGYDQSVISRSTNNKYAATPAGTLPVRFFFTDSFGPEGEEFTNKEVQEMLQRLIEGEDKRHPLSDEKLRLALVDKGFDVSRRTVAKYRDRMKIPVARLRKNM